MTYALRNMRTKLIPAVAVAVQVLLGNLCFMPMAYGMETMPMDHDMQEMEQVTEIAMTPANLMSPRDCDDGCMTITRPRHHALAMGNDRMPCNDGHCLSEHTPSATTVTQSPLKESVMAAILPSSASYAEPLNVFRGDRRDDRRPVQVAFTQTIVLRE